MAGDLTLSLLGKTSLLFHTVRHLRPVQIYGRIFYRLRRPKPDLFIAPPVRKNVGNWIPPAKRAASLIGPGRFRFLNQSGSLESDGWDSPERDKLWRYNQHYFDDLNAHGAEKRRDWHRELIANWITVNTPGQGSGWEPYPTSLRIVNWVKYAFAGEVLSHAFVQSLAVQAHWLGKRLEWHLLGNHLFANAKALVFAGMFFEGPEADRLVACGTRILMQQIPEQILPDGGQFELSPMYHALALEDILDLINLLECFKTSRTAALLTALNERVDAMLKWLATMSHADDRIAFFNDAAFGIAPENVELRDYAACLGFPSRSLDVNLISLPDSGYCRLSAGPALVIVDTAEIGPDYLSAHAHADTLSFELSLFGQRVFVNSGTSVYGTGPERLRQRGTAAHNTVVVQGTDSSEVWGGFRVARRAHVFKSYYGQDGATQVVGASHDGYRRLQKAVLHSREWRLSEDSLSISDKVKSSLRSEVIFHLYPDTSVEIQGPRHGRIQLPNNKTVRWVSNSDVHIKKGTWHPEFGLTKGNEHFVIPLKNGEAKLSLYWP